MAFNLSLIHIYEQRIVLRILEACQAELKGVKPVSYTHLALILPNSKRNLVNWASKSGKPGQAPENLTATMLQPGAEPVSYTHLQEKEKKCVSMQRVSVVCIPMRHMYI